MDHVALDGPGSDDSHLDHQIIKAARPEPWEHAHLSTAFDLKDSNGIGLADHVVDARILWRDGREGQGPFMKLC